MEINRKTLIALVALGILLVLVWARALGVKPKPPAGVSPPAEVSSPASGRPGVVSANPGWKESPFLTDRAGPSPARAFVESKNEEVVLQGILWDPRAPTVILNNCVMGVGDRTGRWEVREIRKDQVILSDGVSTRTLRSE